MSQLNPAYDKSPNYVLEGTPDQTDPLQIEQAAFEQRKNRIVQMQKETSAKSGYNLDYSCKLNLPISLPHG